MRIKLISLNNYLKSHLIIHQLNPHSTRPLIYQIKPSIYHQSKRHLSFGSRLIDRRSFCSNTNVIYEQGQYAKENSQVREYFYYITEEGYLFLDDSKYKNFTSCFKDQKFLKFFFDRLQINSTDRYTTSFPYLSRCGYERNYVRCDDVPIVYTHVLDNNLISFNYAGDLLVVPFLPQNICMCPQSGRLYYPTSKKFNKIGLIRSKLSIEFSKHFIFESTNQSKDKSTDNSFDEPIAIKWKENTYQLSKTLKPLLKDHYLMRQSS